MQDPQNQIKGSRKGALSYQKQHNQILNRLSYLTKKQETQSRKIIDTRFSVLQLHYIKNFIIPKRKTQLELQRSQDSRNFENNTRTIATRADKRVPVTNQQQLSSLIDQKRQWKLRIKQEKIQRMLKMKEQVNKIKAQRQQSLKAIENRKKSIRDLHSRQKQLRIQQKQLLHRDQQKHFRQLKSIQQKLRSQLSNYNQAQRFAKREKSTILMYL